MRIEIQIDAIFHLHSRHSPRRNDGACHLRDSRQWDGTSVAPGESLVICDTGIDHRISNPNSFDLSDADFEWYDESTNPSHTDIDSPTVPNLDKWYCYTLTVFVPHNRGFSSFALARIPIGKEAYLSDYYYDYEYTIYVPAGTFPMSSSAYRLPNEWIVDGVNCSVETDREWNVLPPSIDAGWTHCGAMDFDENRFFKSIRRKMLYLTDDGIRGAERYEQFYCRFQS